MSVLVTDGDRPTPFELDRFAVISKQTRGDIIYLEFEPGRPELGPRNVVVMGERDGISTAGRTAHSGLRPTAVRC